MTSTERGIIAMIAANACFIANDALMKLAMQLVPVGESIFIRGLATGLLFWAIFTVSAQKFELAPLLNQKIALRSLAEIIASVGYLIALANMPIGDLAGLLQLVPLLLMAGAALFLGETIGWRRWTAAAVGLLGAVLIVRPSGNTISAAHAVAAICIAGIVARDLLTRGLSAKISSLSISATSAAGLTLAGLGLGLTESWHTPSLPALAYSVAASAFLIGANTWLVVAMRAGDIGTVGPFRYTALIWALLAGYFIWGEIPTLWSWLGMALLVFAGVYSLRRSAKVRASQIPEPATK
ncbi:MAG: DMT family transporter [Hyphomicrobiaceae bacterium]